MKIIFNDLSWLTIINAWLGGLAIGALVACNYRLNVQVQKKFGFGRNVTFRSLITLLFAIVSGFIVAGVIALIMLNTAFRKNGNIIEAVTLFASGIAIFVYAMRKKFIPHGKR